MTNTERALKQGERILAQVRRNAGKGVKSATVFLAARVKEALNVPAPKTTVTDPWTGEKVTVATQKATPGAPPRKMTGQLQRSITWQMQDEMTGVVGTNVPYARQLEFGGPIYPNVMQALRWVIPVLVPGKGKKKRYVGKSVFSKVVDQKPHSFFGHTAKKHAYQLRIIVGSTFEFGFKSGA